MGTFLFPAIILLTALLYISSDAIPGNLLSKKGKRKGNEYSSKVPLSQTGPENSKSWTEPFPTRTEPRQNPMADKPPEITPLKPLSRKTKTPIKPLKENPKDTPRRLPNALRIDMAGVILPMDQRKQIDRIHALTSRPKKLTTEPRPLFQRADTPTRKNPESLPADAVLVLHDTYPLVKTPGYLSVAHGKIRKSTQ